MRNSLWSGSLKEHLADIDRYITNSEIGIVEVFVLERDNNKLDGFIEINIRNYTAGSLLARVPFVEGWYTDNGLRGRGYGKQLMKAAEQWQLNITSRN